jgi:Heterokaryon incompatibility protein (HET)
MRLLNAQTLSQTDFFGDVPPYAILSHTWGEEEVTFRDLTESTDRSKAAFKKILFCARQAAKDGLQYFWVDTCCIDKSSSTELSEAINSMFRWYQHASKCYVYLQDVSMSDSYTGSQFSQSIWESEFRKSRWFTRGWTLAELIAPASVEFFSREGANLGDKISLEQQIHETTGIPIGAIRGTTPLLSFSVTERMSWAANRQTKRAEDKAYSLLGIFDVHMPLIYGEGGEHALNRLRAEIERSFNSRFF